ncbi:MAG: ATP-dependent RNA helicase RhlE [Alphaproteobacteria bacterium ADurb.BinA305]|nr:MAG: ATP-dependent RNA helicase RhlE [Alphaproteobacteria bacterium ADurb.BinA305]
MNFENLGLAEELLKAVASTGYTTPTPVQQRAIPAAIAGRDLLVSSHTGSGKTAAFTLPALNRIVDRRPAPGSGPRVLVLTPTRELAQQVEKAVQTYGKALRWLNTACLVGGAPMFAQIKQLQRQCDVVVATPGRLLDHLTRRKIKLSDVEVLILDEADRMLDMGFAEDIDAIVAATPAKRQTLLFSATLDGVVGSMATRMTRDAERIEIEVAQEDRGQIEQRLMFADDLGHKSRLLHALLGEDGMNQAVVFTATKRSADELSLALQEKGISAAALHGDMHQTQRNRTLDRLRQGRIGVLVATDVAARGIDVAGISHVINFDPPRQAEDYVHRIGRTGRAGRDGIAITLSGPRETGLIRAIERFTGDRLAVHTIPGMEPSPRKPAGPRPGGNSGRRFGSGAKPSGSSYGRPGGDARRSGGGFSRDGHPSRSERTRRGEHGEHPGVAVEAAVGDLAAGEEARQRHVAEHVADQLELGRRTAEVRATAARAAHIHRAERDTVAVHQLVANLARHAAQVGERRRRVAPAEDQPGALLHLVADRHHAGTWIEADDVAHQHVGTEGGGGDELRVRPRMQPDQGVRQGFGDRLQRHVGRQAEILHHAVERTATVQCDDEVVPRAAHQPPRPDRLAALGDARDDADLGGEGHP